jgi:alpha-1,6-mannosyltransferase
MLAVSSQNYPGGVALSRLPLLVPGNATVYLDVKTCMTGASRFLQDQAPTIRWDKTEDPEVLLTPEFWEGVDWAVTESLERTIGLFEVVDVIRGFSRVKVYRPGSEVGERWWEHGFGLRKLLGGRWVGVEMRDVLWIVKKQRQK